MLTCTCCVVLRGCIALQTMETKRGSPVADSPAPVVAAPSPPSKCACGWQDLKCASAAADAIIARGRLLIAVHPMGPVIPSDGGALLAIVPLACPTPWCAPVTVGV